MSGLEILFLGKEDVDSLHLTLQEVLDVVENGLRAHGNKQVILPSKDHLVLDYPEKLFNVLKGYVEPEGVAGVKVIGDFHGNYRHGLPSELALVTLYDPETGAPFAIVDGTKNTWMRTGAVTAIGAKHLAQKDAKVLGHIGARGTAWYNVPMLDSIFDFEEIRVTSRRPESRARFADKMAQQLGKPIVVTETTHEAVRDADIIIDASRLLQHQVLVADDAVKPGAHLQAYGAVLSVAPTLPFSVDKMVVDDWNQCQQSQYGQFADLVQAGELRSEHIHAEIGEIVAGHKRGRESDAERNLFWHKGFAISDIVLAHLCYTKAKEQGVGTVLPFYASPRDM